VVTGAENSPFDVQAEAIGARPGGCYLMVMLLESARDLLGELWGFLTFLVKDSFSNEVGVAYRPAA
jgi:hypothetical protein